MHMPRLGPRLRIIRRFGTPLPGLTRKDGEKRAFPPGQHGPTVRRSKASEYKRLLTEKQKVRFNYGVSERQLRKMLAEAHRLPGRTGDNLMILLEQRLDNVLFRLGFTATIPAARQLVNHGHVLVNGKRLDKPGARVNHGDTIALSERARNIPDVLMQSERGPEIKRPGWLVPVENDAFAGRVHGAPLITDVPLLVNANAIVEFYAR